MYIVSYVIFFVTYFTIMCCKSVRRKSPGNMIALAVFTLSLSIWVASISVYHDAYWVLMAVGITAALCLGLTLFACQTRWDFTGNQFFKLFENIKFLSFKNTLYIFLRYGNILICSIYGFVPFWNHGDNILGKRLSNHTYR